MKDLLTRVSIKVNDNIYLKNPETSELGKRIIQNSINMIDEMGFECFTFRKLAEVINSTEASIYRYFESKYKLLLYLTSWYWGWMEYRLVFALVNISSPVERLERAINLFTGQVKEDGNFDHIDEVKLDRLVIAESSKVYLTKVVDEENQAGAFTGYKQLVARISDIVTEINPHYKYPHMLVSTLLEGVHHQRYFTDHLPGLTDNVKGEDAIAEFYKELIFSAIKNRKKNDNL